VRQITPRQLRAYVPTAIVDLGTIDAVLSRTFERRSPASTRLFCDRAKMCSDRSLEGASHGEAPPIIEHHEDAVTTVASHDLPDLARVDGRRPVYSQDPNGRQPFENGAERCSEYEVAKEGDNSCGVAFRVRGDNVAAIDDRRVGAATKGYPVAIKEPD
jgi:hypothetical protein